MGSFWTYTLVCFGQLFSIIDPFSAVPVFLGLAGSQTKQEQNGTALRASLTCLIVLTLFGVAGEVIFRFFSITVPAFKVAGGILLFGVALEMMRGHPSDTRSTREERVEAESRNDVGMIPLGLPLLSGPGAIASVMMLVGKATSGEERLAVHVAVVAISLITLLILRSAAFMARVLGKTGINVIGRVMGLILAAVAIQFVIDGAREAFPKLFA